MNYELEYYQLNYNKMKSGLFVLSKENFYSALVYGGLTMLLAGLTYIVGIGDVFLVHVHDLVNVLAMSGAVFLISIIKNLLTNNAGNFFGIKVIPPTN